ncbi:STAS domain-containing protein [Giesbergeria anulus]|uniref:Phospholipid transport system transporter-binding protein n=1 Tax=Giesbergeria anulus TaxID=180197 RepID=A0A1H9IZZ7_9BURK|nr:STAS domain-containing protein [Giesbergeria anulus]SEQ80057.1 phospholipid transport system transporter-binding protein [Giesbergeria anulus]
MPPSVNAPGAPALALPAELTHPQAAATLARLQQAFTTHTDAVLVLDASALRQFDTSALAVLLECRRTVLGQGRSLQVQGLPAALGRMAVLYGVDGLLGLAKAESVE